MRMRKRVLAGVAAAVPLFLASWTLAGRAAAQSLPTVTVNDIGIAMQQRLDLGGVMVMVPAHELHAGRSPTEPGLPGGPPTATPTVGPHGHGHGAPRPEPGPRRPVVHAGGRPAPGRGVPPIDSEQPGQGVPVLYTVLSGPTAELAAVDPATGDAYGTPMSLPGIQGSWTLVQGQNGDVYIGGYEHGDLYRYDPATGVATNLGNPTGDSYIFSLTVDPTTGVIWGGTWPSGEIFSYNPATNDFGQPVKVAPGETYARSVAAYNGHVYVGLGDATAELADHNADTGQTTLIPLPASDRGVAGTVGTVQVVAPDRLYVQFLGGLLYSIPDDHLVSTFGEPSGSAVSSQTLGARMFYVQRDARAATTDYGEGWFQAYDLKTNTEQVYTSPTASFAPYLWGNQPHEVWLVDLHNGAFPGTSIVTLDARAHLTVFDLQTGAFSFTTLTNLPGQPEDIETLGPGPVGTSTLVGSGYLQGDSFTYTPRAGPPVENEGPGQAEGIASVGADIYFGTYPGGTIWRYDPSEPFVFGPSPLLQENPVPVHTIGHNQIRPFVLTPDGAGNLVVGSVPDYGQFGGLLETIRPSTGAVDPLEPLPSPVTDQAPLSATVAAAPGQVEVGTTVSGGSLGTPPQPPSIDPHLFRYDGPSGQAVANSFLSSPFAGQWAIDGLAYDSATGMVYGLTPNLLFTYDPTTGAVTQTAPITQSIAVPSSARSNYYDWGHSSGLVLGSDGYLYALDARANGAILEVDPNNLSYTVVTTGAQRIGVDAAGDVYFAQGADLYSLVPQS
jgi:hypothetical protein